MKKIVNNANNHKRSKNVPILCARNAHKEELRFAVIAIVAVMS